MWVIEDALSIEDIVNNIAEHVMIALIKTPTKGCSLDNLKPKILTANEVKTYLKTELNINNDCELVDAFKQSFCTVKDNTLHTCHFTFYKLSLIII
jgi:hypothetical protein